MHHRLVNYMRPLIVAGTVAAGQQVRSCRPVAVLSLTTSSDVMRELVRKLRQSEAVRAGQSRAMNQ